MVANIGEPFLLSHYDNRRRDSTAPYVTHEQSSVLKAKEGYAAITVHGDGVHVFDVKFSSTSPYAQGSLTVAQISHLHVAGSYILGPSTTFAGPSVSRVITENGTRSRRMYAVIEESPGVRNEDRGRTIWMWDDKQTPEGIGGAQKKKSSITVRR